MTEMAEEEAKERWCPIARNFNNCIASRCMFWRWKKIPNPAWKDETAFVFRPANNPYASEPMTVDSTTFGHCGLAGVP